MFLCNILAHIQALVRPNPPGKQKKSSAERICFSNLVLKRLWFADGCISFIQSAVTGILNSTRWEFVPSWRSVCLPHIPISFKSVLNSTAALLGPQTNGRRHTPQTHSSSVYTSLHSERIWVSSSKHVQLYSILCWGKAAALPLASVDVRPRCSCGSTRLFLLTVWLE